MSARVVAALLFLAIALILPANVYAQSASANLSGTVLDQNGAVVPSATVTISNRSTGLQRQVETNDQGGFTLPLLPPSAYSVRVERQGFSPVEVPDVVLNVGDNKSLQIQLKAGDVNAQVTIDSDAETVRTDGSVGTVVDRKQIASMPLNGRSLQALIQLTPGVVLTGNDGGTTAGAQFSVNGQRTSSNYFTVDGVSANTGINASFFQNQPGQPGAGTALSVTALGGTNSVASLDALQEFRIQTSTYAPEFGRTPGGQFSLVTRAGTNQFTGNLSYYLRNEALDANNWFANAGGQRRPRERQNYVSAALGGPVYLPRFGEGEPAIWSGENRLFFFASYEGLRLEQPKAAQVIVPNLCLRGLASCPAGLSPASIALRPFLNALPLPNGQDFGNGTAQLSASYSDPSSFNIFGLRLDGRITNSLTAFFRFNHAPSESLSRVGSRSTRQHTEAINSAYTGGVTVVAGPRLTADVRVNWTDNLARLFSDLDDFNGAVVPDAAVVFAPGRNPSNSLASFFPIGASWAWGAGSSDKQRQFNIVGTVAYVKGSHQLKFGVDYRRLMPFFGETGGAYENIIFSRAGDLINGICPSCQITSVAPTRREPIISALSLFAQDTWKAGQRLTLTYGGRFEYVPPPGEATGQYPLVLLGIESNPPQNVHVAPKGTPLFNGIAGLAPRFGVAYQLSRRSGWETTLRGGVGQFYDLPFASIAGTFEFTWPFYAKTTVSRVPFPPHPTPPVPGTDKPDSLSLLDRNIKLPYAIEWNGAWEQGIGKAQTITATYVGARGRRLLGSEFVLFIPIPDFPAGPLTLTQLDRTKNISQSKYDALQLQFTRRLSHGLQALASYTFGRSIDDLSSNFAQPIPNLSGNLFAAHGLGPSNFDVRHVFSSAASYDLPGSKRAGFVRLLTSGWGSDLLFRYQSAPPYNVVNGFTITPEGTFYQPQLNLIPGVAIYVNDPTTPGGRRLNTTVPSAAQIAQAGCSPTDTAKGAFCTPPADQQGNFRRNGLRAFSAWQADLALRRQFVFNDRLRLQLGAELFNLFNHPNFSGVDTDINSGTFGRARQTLNTALGGLNPLYQMGGPRSAQLSVKLLW